MPGVVLIVLIISWAGIPQEAGQLVFGRLFRHAFGTSGRFTFAFTWI